MTRRTTSLLTASAALLLAGLCGCAAHTPGQSAAHPAQDAQVQSAASSVNATQALALVDQGRRLDAAGRSEAAFGQYARAAALAPSCIPARYHMGMALLQQGRSERALEAFNAVLSAEPDHAKALEGAGIVSFRNGLYDEAEARLTRAAHLDPSLHRAYAHLGAIHNYRGDFAAAVTAFRTALDIAPDSTPDSAAVWNNLGMTYTMMEREADAVRAFAKALRLGAPLRRTSNNMGLALARMGRYPEALEAFRSAEGDAGAYNNLGYVHLMQERYDDAIACFETAIRLEPGYYERASENLRRARLARSFAQSAPHAPTEAAPAQRAHDVRSYAPDGTTVTKADSTLNFLLDSVGINNSTLEPTPLGDLPVYTVHVCSWRSVGKARRIARELIRKGYNAHVSSVKVRGKGKWYRVTAGEFMELQSAQQLQCTLKRDHGYRNLRIIKRTPATGAKSNT
jgi:tetratricopeptide (TPR) repeat protein